MHPNYTTLKVHIIFVILLTAEMIYFRIADKFKIIDKPNQRSSHSSIVLRGEESYSLSEHGYGAHFSDSNIRGPWPDLRSWPWSAS